MKRDVIGHFTFNDVMSEENSSGNSLTQKKKKSSLYLSFRSLWKFGLLWRLACDVYWKKL